MDGIAKNARNIQIGIFYRRGEPFGDNHTGKASPPQFLVHNDGIKLTGAPDAILIGRKCETGRRAKAVAAGD